MSDTKPVYELEPLSIGTTKNSKNPKTYIFLGKDEERFCVFTNERKHFVMTPLLVSKNKETLVDLKAETQSSNHETLVDITYANPEYENYRVEAINYLLNYESPYPLFQKISFKVQDAYNSYLSANKAVIFNINEQEQETIIESFKKSNTSRSVILQELINSEYPKTEVIEIESKKFRRDNATIAKIKYVRGVSCQLCGTSIIKKNGEGYIEAAHIEPKHLKGKESLANIILLCPNHHKEFDLGDRKIIKHTDTFVELCLNGRTYPIQLIPDLIRE